METLRELQPCRWTLPTDVPEHRVPPKLVAETGRQSIYKTTGNCFKMFERLTSQDHDFLNKIDLQWRMLWGAIKERHGCSSQAAS